MLTVIALVGSSKRHRHLRLEDACERCGTPPARADYYTREPHGARDTTGSKREAGRRRQRADKTLADTEKARGRNEEIEGE